MGNVIKKIKIKKEDGTFTDYIPIGVEAENVDVDGESVQVKLNKTPYYYNNVEDMKADKSLKVGDMAITLGYYDVNDCGGAEYKVVNGEYEDDGGSYHQLNNGLFAELVAEHEITPEQFGCYGDGEHDDTACFKNALVFSQKTGKIIKSSRKQTYIINEQLVLNQSSVGLDLGNATLKTTNADLDFILRINDNIGRRSITNVTLDCNNLCGGIYVNWASSFTLERIYILNVKTYGIYIYKGNLHIRNIRILNTGNNNSTGIYTDGTDSKVEHVTIRGCRIGIDNQNGVNFYDMCHVWLPSGFNIDGSIAFNINGGAHLTTCYSDTYQIGYRVVNTNALKMNDCFCFINGNVYVNGATQNPRFIDFVSSDSSSVPFPSSAQKTYLYSFTCSMNATGFTPEFSNCNMNDVMKYLPLKTISKNANPWGLVDYWLTEFSGVQTDNFTLIKNQLKIYDDFIDIDIQGKPADGANLEPNTAISIILDPQMPFNTSSQMFLVPITTSETNPVIKGMANVKIISTLTTRSVQIAYIDNVIRGYNFRINKIISRF